MPKTKAFVKGSNAVGAVGRNNRNVNTVAYNGTRGNMNRPPVVEKFYGHTLFLTSTNAGATAQRVVGMHPRNMQDDRLLLMADMYETYAIQNFRVRYMGHSNNGLIVAYRPGLTIDATPVNAEQVSVSDRMKISFCDQTVPVTLNLSPGMLHGEKDYYGTTDTTDQPGALFISAFSTAGATVAADFQLWFSYEYVFYGRVDPAVTKARILKDLKDADDDGDTVASWADEVETHAHRSGTEKTGMPQRDRYVFESAVIPKRRSVSGPAR